MEKVTTKNESNSAVDESLKEDSKPEADEIVLYDECGDTLWDRVLRQEENKIKFPSSPNV